MRAVVAAGTVRRLAHLTLLDDPFVHRLAPGSHGEAVDHGLAAGQAAAEMVVGRWGRRPEEIAARLRVPITRSSKEARAGRVVFFSEYGNRPPSITLYQRSVDEANRMIREHALEGILGVSEVAPVHLAHELYHHLEFNGLTAGTGGFRIQTHRLGPLRFWTGLPSLSEIAADRFATVLLGLVVPPKAMEFITVYALDRTYAWKLMERLREQPG